MTSSNRMQPVSEIRTTKSPELIRRYMIQGERRFSNYWWASVIFLGSTGFVLTGLSSFFVSNLITNAQTMPSFPFVNSTDIVFFPQGLLMLLYGILGFILTIYWSLLIFWNVGGGFNEFNKKDGIIRIFRWGYPGKQRKLDFTYPLKDVEAIRVEFLQGSASLSLDQRRTIYLCLKGKREIPLTGVGEPLSLKEIEKQASELANFLQVSLEGL